MSSPNFHNIIATLEEEYGPPKPPKITDPFGMILWENVAYLVDDEQRDVAFAALKKRIGLTAKKILAARDKDLLEVAALGGMLPPMRVEKLRRIAQITTTRFKGDLRPVLKLPLKQAMRALKIYPGIADAGAEKILLFSGTLPVLALESNGLRVLVRLGYGEESKNYSAMYRSAQRAAEPEIPPDCAWLTKAHQLLRQHGRELCKTNRPLCHQCPLTRCCRFYQGR